MTKYHQVPASTAPYWPIITLRPWDLDALIPWNLGRLRLWDPETSQYCHILIQYHQVPLLIHHLNRHSSANWINSLFTTHLMSHAQYTWSSLMFRPQSTCLSDCSRYLCNIHPFWNPLSVQLLLLSLFMLTSLQVLEKMPFWDCDLEILVGLKNRGRYGLHCCLWIHLIWF